MNISMEQLRYKEVVSLADGTRFGYVGDLEVDTDLGQVTALIIQGRPRLLGLLGREPDRTIPWSAVRRFGEDIVLADPARPAGRLVSHVPGPAGGEEPQHPPPHRAAQNFFQGPAVGAELPGGTPPPAGPRPRAGCGHF